MFELGETKVHTFGSRQRGVNVTCRVSVEPDGTSDVSVVVPAETLSTGLRSISKFAGYCRRSLLLISGEDDAWAEVLASYFGFGLILVSAESCREVMQPPLLDSREGQVPRQAFTRRVLSELSAP